MRDIYKLCGNLRMLANTCDVCDAEKIQLYARELAGLLRDAAEMLEMQNNEIGKSNEKILFLLDTIIEGRN